MKIERRDRANAKTAGWAWEPCDFTSEVMERLAQSYGDTTEVIRVALERGEQLSTGFADYRKSI